MPKLLKSALALTALIAGMGSAANAYTPANTPDVYVVMFRADWCAPCKVVEPALVQASNMMRDPRVEFLTIDISGGQGDANAHAVFDRGIVRQYNEWMGVTGFAAIIDGDTKQTMGCVNMTYDADSMAMHIQNLKNRAIANQPTFDITCPEPNNAL